MTHINLGEILHNYDGTPLTSRSDEEKLTVFDVFAIALEGTLQTETLTAEKKNEIYQLSKKVYKNKNKEINLSDSQATLIKDRVGKVYASPLIVGRITDLIDGEKPEDEEPKETPPGKKAVN